MLTQLVIANTLSHIVHIIGAFAYFACGWLHLDSYLLDKRKFSYLLRSAGLFIIALSGIYESSFLNNQKEIIFFEIFTIIALIMIIISLISEGLLTKVAPGFLFIPLMQNTTVVSKTLSPLTALLFFLTAIIYLVKSTRNLERQLRPLFWAFLFSGFSKVIQLFQNYLPQNSVYWQELTGDFSIFWYAELLLYFLSVVLILVWTWGYIRFRANVQIFMATVSSTIIVFILTTTLFLIFLIKNIESSALNHLATDVKVFKYALETHQLETLTIVESLANDSQIGFFLAESNRDKLYESTYKYVLSKKLKFLNFTDARGTIILRAQDRYSYGDSAMNDETVFKAVNNQKLSTLAVQTGIINDEIVIKSTVPVINSDGEVVGTISGGFGIDNSFVDGVKEITDLDTTVFAGKKRSATTLVSLDGKSRNLGTQINNPQIIDTLFKERGLYLGKNEILNISYYVSYLPLLNYNNETIGFIGTAEKQSDLQATIEQSTKSTFFGVSILIMLSIFPSYFLARFIEKNLNA